MYSTVLNSISVVFVCKSCGRSFQQVYDFIEHKKKRHFQEYQRTKCIVFEESQHLTDPSQNSNEPGWMSSTARPVVVKVETEVSSNNVPDPDDSGGDVGDEFDDADGGMDTDREMENSITSALIGTTGLRNFAETVKQSEFQRLQSFKPEPPEPARARLARPGPKSRKLSISKNQDNKARAISKSTSPVSWQNQPPSLNPYVLVNRLAKNKQTHQNSTTIDDPADPRSKNPSIIIKSEEIDDESDDQNEDDEISQISDCNPPTPTESDSDFELPTETKSKQLFTSKLSRRRSNPNPRSRSRSKPRPKSKSEPQKTHDGNGVKTGPVFKCELCNKMFSSSATLKSHNLIFHGTEEEKMNRPKFKCELCSKEFVLRRTLRFHIDTKHNNDTTKQFQCELCGYSTNRKEVLHRHLKSHSEDRPFQCTEPNCVKSFKLKHNLTAHLATHSEEYPFTCPYPDCKLTFKHQRNIKGHYKFHFPAGSGSGSGQEENASADVSADLNQPLDGPSATFSDLET